MKAVSLFGATLAVMLLAGIGLASAQGSGPPSGRAGFDRAQSGNVTGMTGNFRGWQSRHGSGSGANNFVGNGRGHPGGNASAGHFGGWFANNHHGRHD